MLSLKSVVYVLGTWECRRRHIHNLYQAFPVFDLRTIVVFGLKTIYLG